MHEFYLIVAAVAVGAALLIGYYAGYSDLDAARKEARHEAFMDGYEKGTKEGRRFGYQPAYTEGFEAGSKFTREKLAESLLDYWVKLFPTED